VEVVWLGVRGDVEGCGAGLVRDWPGCEAANGVVRVTAVVAGLSDEAITVRRWMHVDMAGKFVNASALGVVNGFRCIQIVLGILCIRSIVCQMDSEHIFRLPWCCVRCAAVFTSIPWERFDRQGSSSRMRRLQD
jgi:hypothetical protein